MSKTFMQYGVKPANLAFTFKCVPCKFKFMSNREFPDCPKCGIMLDVICVHDKYIYVYEEEEVAV